MKKRHETSSEGTSRARSLKQYNLQAIKKEKNKKSFFELNTDFD